MTLRRRFTWAIGGVTAVLVVLHLSLMLAAERAHLKAELDRSRRADARRFSLLCAESVLSKDDIVLVNYLKSLARPDGAAWGMFISPEGRVLAHGDVSMRGRVLADGSSRRAAAAREPFAQSHAEGGRAVTEYIVPVEAGLERLGAARLAYDAAATEARVRGALAETARRFLGATVLSLALAALAAALVAGGLTGPIARLTEGARRIAAGALDTRLRLGRDDEIGRLADEFDRMAARLGEVDRMKDAFVETVSHDLRNPLGAVRMSAKILLDSKRKPNPEQKRMLEIILSSADRLTATVNNILDAARLREGRMDYHLTTLSPAALVREVAGLYEASARDKGIRLKVEAAADAPLFEADAEKVHRALVNLVSNAFKFTRTEGEVSIGAAAAGGGAYVRFLVADTGIGIPAARWAELFRRFSTVSGVEAAFRPAQGAGLGLAIVRALAEGHGGRVFFSSEEGRGTVFALLFPVAARVSPAGGAA